MAAREPQKADSDGNGSMTPSEQSDNDERSEHDSDYETDDGEDHGHLVTKYDLFPILVDERKTGY